MRHPRSFSFLDSLEGRFMAGSYHPTRMAQIAFLGLAIACPAWAGDRSDDDAPLGSYRDAPREWITRDRDGRQTGRVSEKPYGAAVYDRNGNRQGWIEDRASGDRVQYDHSGSRVGTIERR